MNFINFIGFILLFVDDYYTRCICVPIISSYLISLFTSSFYPSFSFFSQLCLFSPHSLLLLSPSFYLLPLTCCSSTLIFSLMICCHSVNLSLCHSFTMSLFHYYTLSHYHSFSPSLYHSLFQSFTLSLRYIWHHEGEGYRWQSPREGDALLISYSEERTSWSVRGKTRFIK